MATLPDHLWRRAVELFLLAGRENNGGELPPISEMAWTLRTTEEELQQDITALIDTGIISSCDTNNTVTNYSKRQSPVPSTERWRQHKDRKRSDEYHANVTQTKPQTKRLIDTDTDTDTDIDTDKRQSRLINAPPPEKSEKLTDRQRKTRLFLDALGGLSFTSNDQPAEMDYLFQTYGEDMTLEIAKWMGSKNPRSVTHAINAIRTAAPTWGDKKNGGKVSQKELQREALRKKYGDG